MSAALAVGTDTWLGNTDLNWNTAANWTTSGGSTPPGNGDSIIFGAAGSAGTSLNNNLSGLTINNWGINGSGAAFTFGGNSVTLSGVLTNGASAIETISLAIAGTGSVTNLAGTLVLAAANTYSGATVLSGGTIKLGANNALGYGKLDVATGSGGASRTFDFNGYSLTNTWTNVVNANGLTVANNGSAIATNSGNFAAPVISDFTINGTADIRWAGQFNRSSGAFNLTKSGNNTVTFAGSAANVNVGNLIVSGGTAVMAQAGNTPTFATSATVNNSGTLRFSNVTVTSGSAWAGQFNSTVTVNSGGTLDTGGASGQTIRFQQLVGAGLVTNSAATPSVIEISARDAAYQLFSGTMVDGANGGTVGITFTNAGTTGGPRTNIFSGANTYSGATTIAYGKLRLDNANAVSNSTVIVSASGGLIFSNNIGTFNLGGLSGAQGVALFDLAGGSVTLQIGNNGQNTTNTSGLSGGGGIIKAGPGTLTLNAAQAYSGNTVIKAGTLALGASGSFANTPSLTISNGATLDVSSVSGFTLGGSQVLYGSGSNNGSVSTTSGTKIYAGLDAAGGYATNTFKNNLTCVSGALVYLDLADSATLANDQIKVAGTLTLNNTTFHLKAPGTSDNLDQTTDYVLCTAGSIVGAPNATPTWDVQPANYANFSITTNAAGTQVLLHYASAIALSGSGSATPASVTHFQTTTLAVTVTPGTQPSSTGISVTVDASPVGGPNPLSLVSSNGTYVYTNSVTVSSNTTLGLKTLNVTIADAQGRQATPTIGMAVNANTTTWNGGGSDDNWSTAANWNGTAPGTVGDYVIFSGSTRPTPSLDNNYNVAALTFDSSATSFSLSTSSSTLTLSGGLTNNSAGAQTLNVPVVLNGSQTVNAASGNVTLGGAVSGSGAALIKTGLNKLMLSAPNTYDGGTTISAGTVQIGSAKALGTGSAVLGGSGMLDLNGQAITNALATIGSGAVLTNSSTSAATVSTAIGSASASQLGNFTVGASGNVTLNDVYGAQFACTLTKTGPGTLTLGGTGVNGAGGNPLQLTVNGGTVVLAKTGMGAAADGVTVNSGAVLQMDPTHTTTGWLPWAGQLNAGLTLAGGTLDLNGVGGHNNLMRYLSGTSGLVTNSSTTPAELEITSREANSAYIFSGNIVDGLDAGKVSVTFTNSGAINSGRTNIFAGNNTYSGDTTVGFGTFELGNVNAAQNSTINLVSSSGLLPGTSLFEFAGGIGTFTIGGLEGSQNFTLADVTGSAVTLNLGNNGAPTTYSGVMSGAGGIGKLGSGTLTLSGNNTYTGNTTINGGALALNGSGSISNTASITLAGGATLDVSGLSSTFALGSGQALVASHGVIVGNANLNVGSLILNYVSGTPVLLATNGTIAFNHNPVTVTVSGGALTAGGYKLIAKTTGGMVAGTLPATVTVNGSGATAPASLQIIGDELYLVVGATVTTLVSSKNPSGFNDAVNFTSGVQTNGVIAGGATGSVTFYTNGTAVTTNALAGGGAGFTLSVLPRGTNLITAIYSGDGSYLPSTNALNQVVTNHPPVAGNVVYTRNAGVFQLKIALTSLLTNVTDVDGDSIILVSTGVSTNSVNLTAAGGDLVYYNTNDVNDQLDYTVSDGFGGTNTGTLRIVVGNVTTGQMTGQLTSFTGNGADLTFHAIPNYPYITQRTTDLDVWVDIATNTAGTNGVLNVIDRFSDLGGTPPASAYYRLKYQP